MSVLTTEDSWQPSVRISSNRKVKDQRSGASLLSIVPPHLDIRRNEKPAEFLCFRRCSIKRDLESTIRWTHPPSLRREKLEKQVQYERKCMLDPTFLDFVLAEAWTKQFSLPHPRCYLDDVSLVQSSAGFSCSRSSTASCGVSLPS